jgi:hypothetical protein
MRKSRPRRHRLVPALILAALLATASYAFTATNTVPGTNAGQGAQTISGYTASNVTYDLDTSSGTAMVTGATFDLTPDSSGNAPTDVEARLTSTGTYVNCSNSSGTTWTCAFSGVTALSTASLDIAAVQ